MNLKLPCIASDQTWCIYYVRILRSDRSQTEEKRVAYEPRIVESDFSVLRSTKMLTISKLIDSLAIRTTVASLSNESFSNKWDMPTCFHPLSSPSFFIRIGHDIKNCYLPDRTWPICWVGVSYRTRMHDEEPGEGTQNLATHSGPCCRSQPLVVVG